MIILPTNHLIQSQAPGQPWLPTDSPMPLGSWHRTNGASNFIFSSGNEVDQWLDVSGNGRHGSYDTESTGPVVYEDVPKRLNFQGAAFLFLQDYPYQEIWAVFYNLSLPQQALSSRTDASRHEVYIITNDPSLTISVRNGGTAAINGYEEYSGARRFSIDTPPGYVPFPISTTTPDIVMARFATEDCSSIGLFAATGGLNRFFNGYWKEFITYETFNTVEDRERLFGYLAWEHGIESKLSPDNAYKDAPPTKP